MVVILCRLLVAGSILLALDLKDILADYNNNRLCGAEGPGTPPPNTAPIMSITSPAVDASVSGSSVEITATAADDSSVTKVEFFVDGSTIGVDSDGADGWSMSWDLTRLTDGDLTISATATDDADQT